MVEKESGALPQITLYRQCKPLIINGGERGIRTLDRVSPIHAFQACAFNHSAISPGRNDGTSGQVFWISSQDNMRGPDGRFGGNLEAICERFRRRLQRPGPLALRPPARTPR